MILSYTYKRISLSTFTIAWIQCLMEKPSHRLYSNQWLSLQDLLWHSISLHKEQLLQLYTSKKKDQFSLKWENISGYCNEYKSKLLRTWKYEIKVWKSITNIKIICDLIGTIWQYCTHSFNSSLWEKKHLISNCGTIKLQIYQLKINE